MEEQTITGTITEAADDTVTIETEDGTKLTFSIPAEADQTGVTELQAGDQLEVTYTGTIDGEDTTNATVVKLVQTAADAQ